MKLLKALGLALLVLAVAAVAAVITSGLGWYGEHEAPGTIAGRAIPADVVAGRVRAQRAAAATRGADPTSGSRRRCTPQPSGGAAGTLSAVTQDPPHIGHDLREPIGQFVLVETR